MYDFLLTRSTDTGRPVAGQGSLAKSYDMSKNMMTYTFHLVKGARFHANWGEVTAEDVKFSYELVTSDQSKNDGAGVLRTDIKSIDGVNPYTVIFHMKAPSWDFLEWVDEVFPYVGIVSKKYVEKVGKEEAGRKPIGSGPFKFKEHVFGDHITVEANEDYWYVMPRLKNITWKKVPDPATRLMMLRAGEAQLIPIVYDQIKEVRQTGLQLKPLLGVTQLTVHFMGMYVHPKYDPKNTPPWAVGKWWEKDSPAHKVRRALSLAIDRQTIVDHVLYGYGTLEGCSVAPAFPGYTGHDPNKKVIPFDPKLALQLLKEAGYANPADLKVEMDLTPHGARPFGKQVGEAIVSMWKGLGVTVTTSMATDYPSFMLTTGDRKAFRAWTWPLPQWGSGAHTILANQAGEDSYLCFFGEPPEITRLLRKAKACKTYDELVAIDKALEDYLYDNDITAAVAYADNLYAMAPNLVWPTKAGMTGVMVHNFAYMYFK
jgi:ABC-type transport system substrate-binding protein